ncbi:MAG: folate-binding protein [Gammaproteobacteria bacterium]|nr:folate-binding protein [Gammaproteobacteria bacterium]
MKDWLDHIQNLNIAPLETRNSLCVLSDIGLLYVGGEDAADFLQNQLSNDISHIDHHTLQLSSFSNAKGRMHAVLRVIQIEGGYLLLLPRSILPLIQEELQKFVILSKVILADITDSFARIAWVTDHNELIKDHYPTEINQVYQSDSLICIRLPEFNSQHRFLMLTNDSNEAITLFDELNTVLTLNDMSSWQFQEIQSGIPTIYKDNMGAFVLQMCNLQLLDGVNFKKGCYPGQEVVARMHYLGKLKRRMYLAELKSTHCPPPAAELKSRDAQDNDGSGKVIDAVKVEHDTCLMLFSAQIDKAESNRLVLADQPESEIQLKSLPYSFPE